MAANDRSMAEEDYGCYPYQQIKEVHDAVREDSDTLIGTDITGKVRSPEKLMRPDEGEEM